MPVLPPSASYKFRIHDDAAQRCFQFPTFLARRDIDWVYLVNEPTPRAHYACGHNILIQLTLQNNFFFDIGGLAEYEHAGEEPLVRTVRDVATHLFGETTSIAPATTPNHFDRFIARAPPAQERASLVAAYVRHLSDSFPVTRGRIEYQQIRPHR
jgi:hypothetical protein